ncbi:MAG: hypothetical protein ACRDRL_24585 [Sciscionella sp.]
MRVAEVLAADMTWTHLADEAPNNWVHDTPSPSPTVHAATELGALADRLVHRAADILSPPTTSYGYDGERRIDPDEIEWAITHGGTLHVIEHGDGSVTFTKRHRDHCPFVTSAGTQECGDRCVFEHPLKNDSFCM